ncbi:MAG: putative glycoside hydrolase [bacterium]|nr:putative glycoside hydrolase [bacterium]
MIRIRNHFFIAAAVAILAFFAFYFFIPSLSSVAYKSDSDTPSRDTQNVASSTEGKEPEFVATHVQTPNAVKAIYMTACVATMPSFRNKLVAIADTTEVNSIIIDVKDFSGTIAFTPVHPLLKDNAGTGCRTKDLREFIAELHKKGIYTIARITVFQDPYFTKNHPELAVHKKSDGSVWKDRKGLSFVDVSAKPYWEYVVALGKESYAMGFDELNFDYIRFPSDGDMKDIEFTWSKGMTKPEALEHFFVYLHNAFKDTGVKTSADLFGMTTTNTDDLNIGQVLERTMPYFDYVAPMVYPSHYPPNFNGWKNPNNHSYDLIKFVMTKGAERAVATTTVVEHFGGVRVGTSTPAIYTKDVYNRNKLRPWLQDFDYGGDYTAVEVRAQIQATYDSGLNSWFLWDPKNLYTKEALLKE